MASPSPFAVPGQTYLYLDQGVYFLVQRNGVRWDRQLAPRPLPNFPLLTTMETPMNAPSAPVPSAPAFDTAVFSADLRKEAAKEAVATLLDADLGPVSLLLCWFPEGTRALVVVAALRFLAAHPELLQVAGLSPKQTSAFIDLANDAYVVVVGPLVGGWLRKLGPTLRKVLGAYDPASADKKESSRTELVGLLAEAMGQAARSEVG